MIFGGSPYYFRWALDFFTSLDGLWISSPRINIFDLHFIKILIVVKKILFILFKRRSIAACDYSTIK